MSRLPDQYPNAPGFKTSGPSSDAAEKIAPVAGKLRAQVLECFKQHPEGMTADEAAAEMGRSILSVRPRVTELLARGEIEETGDRRRNDSGMTATVWRAKAQQGDLGL